MHTKRRELTGHRGTKGSYARTLWCETSSYLGAAEGICMLVRHFLQQIRMPYLVFATELVVRECLNNAIHHGNREDPQKGIKLCVTAAQNHIRVRVADEGKGFDWKRIMALQPAASTDCSGRGLAVIGTYASRIAFNTKGNVITVDISDKSVRRA